MSETSVKFFFFTSGVLPDVFISWRIPRNFCTC